jgi:hypothetical protein
MSFRHSALVRNFGNKPEYFDEGYYVRVKYEMEKFPTQKILDEEYNEMRDDIYREISTYSEKPHLPSGSHPLGVG